jgi:hypothetical protein
VQAVIARLEQVQLDLVRAEHAGARGADLQHGGEAEVAAVVAAVDQLHAHPVAVHERRDAGIHGEEPAALDVLQLDGLPVRDRERAADFLLQRQRVARVLPRKQLRLQGPGDGSV